MDQNLHYLDLYIRQLVVKFADVIFVYIFGGTALLSVQGWFKDGVIKNEILALILWYSCFTFVT